MGGGGTDPNPLSVDEIFSTSVRLASWPESYMNVWVLAAARAEEGGSSAAEGRFKIEFVDVVDNNGQIVPIKKICTASGATYQ